MRPLRSGSTCDAAPLDSCRREVNFGGGVNRTDLVPTNDPAARRPGRSGGAPQMKPISAAGPGQESLSRRTFAKAGTAAALSLSAASYARVLGANERVGV